MQLGGIDIVVLLIRRILRHLDGPRLYASFCRLWKGGEVQIERGVRSVSERREEELPNFLQVELELPFYDIHDDSI